MENENNDRMNGEELPENEFEQEDIPLWLQGIEEVEDEGVTPDIDKDAPDQWIKEIPEALEEDIPELDSSEDLIQHGEVLPDWIEEEPLKSSEVSYDPNSKDVQEYEINASGIEQEAIEPQERETPETGILEDMDSGDQMNMVQDDNELEPNEEEFFDISEADIQDEKQPVQDISSSDEEELPSWLQEMITEQPEKEALEQKLEGEDSEAVLEDLPVNEEVRDEPIEQDLPQEIKHDLSEAQLDDADMPTPHPSDLMAEDNTKPVFIQSEDEFQPEMPEFEEGNDQDLPDVLPKALNDARMQLEDGDYSGAVEAINACQEKSQYHDEIRSWFLSAAESDTSKTGDIWEAVGDLESSEDNPKQALDAYTKAIRSLLNNEKDFNEVD